jgi:hypothetical protein
MKKQIYSVVFVVLLAITMTSCYSLSYSVGKGSQSGVEIKGKNHYLIEGLIPVKTSDVKQLSDGSTDYNVKIVHSFVDGLLAAITGGLYTPTTVIVTK